MASLVHRAHQAGKELRLREARGDTDVCGVRSAGERVHAHVDRPLSKEKPKLSATCLLMRQRLNYRE